MAAHDIEKSKAIKTRDIASDDIKYEIDDSSTHKQDGVKKVEAITTAWSKKTMVVMFVLLWVVSLVDFLIVAVQSNLNAYVTSAFSKHSLLATTSIIASILGGSSRLAIAKLIDIWGRVEGFLAMLLLVSIGLITKATCQNVETYAAAHTLYWTGHLGLLFVIDVVLSDMTSLRNRMLPHAITINSTPNVCSIFLGGIIADRFYYESNFRWAFGSFCIILVGVCTPVAIIMLLNQRKAAKMGLNPQRKSHGSWYQTCKHYLIEFDVVGIILITAGFSLILLPFSLASSSKNKWKSGSIITMIVVGVVCLIAFVLWEKYVAPVQFFPFRYLKERTIVGACLLYGFMFISIFTWDTYYFSYLQVVHRQRIVYASYILNTFSLTSTIVSPGVAYLIRRFGNFKYITYAGIPFVILGTALLIPLRTPSTTPGLLVMCQIFNGIAGGIFATCSILAVMAVVTHQEIAAVQALHGLFGSIGAAIGQTIAGGLWTNVLPQALYRELPENNKDLVAEIYSSLTIQTDYAPGTPIRAAIDAAYSDVQKRMVIAGSCIVPILLITIVMWRSVNVRKMEEAKDNNAQTKGTVW